MENLFRYIRANFLANRLFPKVEDAHASVTEDKR